MKSDPGRDLWVRTLQKDHRGKGVDFELTKTHDMVFLLHWQKTSLNEALKNGMVLITIMLVVVVDNMTQTKMYSELMSWSSIPRSF